MPKPDGRVAHWRNWSGRVTARPAARIAPGDEKELAHALAQSKGPVRVAGSGHSFTPLVETDGTLISLDAMSGVAGHNAAQLTARLLAGTKIHALGRPLYDLGLGLKNQGDIDRQAIAGALSTATHGTGRDLPCLAAELLGFRLVTAQGEVLQCSAHENADIFAAGRVNLGLFGVFCEVTLSVRRAYRLKEKGWTGPASEILRDLHKHRDAHRHFEFFWFPYADDLVVKILDETDEPAPEPMTSDQMAARGEAMTGDQRAFQAGCEIARFIPAVNPFLHRTFSKAAAGRTKVRWSHEAFPSPRNVRFNELEYAVPAQKGADCLQEIVAHIRQKRIATTYPIEFRFIKADDLWLSPFYQRDSVSISVHQYAGLDPEPLFDACEAIFSRYEGRPHWGKCHKLNARTAESLYPRFNEFRKIRKDLDPAKRFLNRHLAEVLGEGGHA